MARPTLLERYARVTAALVDVLALRPRTYATVISETADTFTQSIRAAMGPDVLARQAAERYVRGSIEIDELERELGRIADEFGRIP